MLRKDEKNSHNQNNYEGMYQARITNLEEKRARLREKNLLQSSKSENDDEKHHHELLRHSVMKIRKVEPTVIRI